MKKHLFLFGGGPPFTPVLASKFSNLNTMDDSIAILFLERKGSEEYLQSTVTHILEEKGIKNFYYIPLQSTPVDIAVDRICKSSSIIICGGDTNRYADYIVETNIAKAIKESYNSGKPIVGFSAGALISPDVCIISAKDNEKKEYQERNGLGLIHNTVISVHYTEWRDEDHLMMAVKRYPSSQNFGIDERTGIYLVNGELINIEGNGVYSIRQHKVMKLNNYL